MLREFTESHPIATAIAALIVVVVGFVGWNNVLFSALGQLSNDARVVAALITAGGAIFGIVISGIFSIGRDAWNCRRDGRAVATALLLETCNQCDSVANCGSIANAALKHPDKTVGREHFVFFEPVEPRIFFALAPRISTLPTRASRAVIAFHASTQAAKSLVDRLREGTINGEDASKQNKNVSVVWKQAAHYGLQAINELDKLSDIDKAERRVMESLKEELSLISSTDAHPTMMLQT